MYNKDKLFKELNINMTESQKSLIISRLTYILNYEPKIGILGKTGVGKSSLCNALFGEAFFNISDVKACTRNIKEEFLKIGDSKGIKLIDVPGIGENRDRDEAYAELYAKLMPELDLILWVIKADDRALASDESFYKNIVRPHIKEGKPFFFVLNQVDKIEPFREWDTHRHIPSPAQFQNINTKVLDIARFFEVPASKIVHVSASEGYNLTELVNEIIFALPNERKITFYKEVSPNFKSEVAGEYVKRGFLDVVGDIIVEVLEMTGEAIVKVVDFMVDASERFLKDIEGNASIVIGEFLRKIIS